MRIFRPFRGTLPGSSRICVKADSDRASSIHVEETVIANLLGPRKYTHETVESAHRVGVTTGLVWTEFGGEIISVEASLMKGTQQLILTGSLGEVIRESAQTALSYIRSHASEFLLDPDFFKGNDIHIHIPVGAIPKDGPSAGVTIAVALLSLLTRRPARGDAALSGELSLSGTILPVSGIREKLLAAQRAGVKTIVLPARNRIDVEALDQDTKEGLRLELVENVASILDIVLLKEKK
ncbi:MAG: S16 family serine protease [Syntrophobacteraceae bacterium]